MNRSQFPNGGWSFFQASTNWWAPAPGSNTFDQQVINIIRHRLANPAITAKFKLATDVPTVAGELEQFTAKRLGLPDPKSSPPPMRQQLAGAAVVAVENIKKLAFGAAVLLEWETSKLPPVASEVARNRAETCTRCPKNNMKGLTHLFTAPIAEVIRKRLVRLYAMNLTTPFDDKLGICDVCLCELKLKSHEPMQLIQAKLKPQMRAALWENCWIHAEEKSGKAPSDG